MQNKTKENVLPTEEKTGFGISYLSFSGTKVPVDCAEEWGRNGSKENRKRRKTDEGRQEK